MQVLNTRTITCKALRIEGRVASQDVPDNIQSYSTIPEVLLSVRTRSVLFVQSHTPSMVSRGVKNVNKPTNKDEDDVVCLPHAQTCSYTVRLLQLWCVLCR
jgi:hypothetical protein